MVWRAAKRRHSMEEACAMVVSDEENGLGLVQCGSVIESVFRVVVVVVEGGVVGTWAFQRGVGLGLEKDGADEVEVGAGVGEGDVVVGRAILVEGKYTYIDVRESYRYTCIGARLAFGRIGE
jgi:hypothetical protein